MTILVYLPWYTDDMPSSQIKRIAGALILLGTLALLIYYWQTHPEITSQLRAVNPVAVGAIIGLYLAMSAVLVLIYDAILRLSSKPIPLGEHALLTIYSSIINFFGPLQSGPGFRTVYLKQKHGVSVKSYLSGTLVYYLLFGLCNLVFLAVGIVAPLLLPLVLLTVVAALAGLRALPTDIALLQRIQTGLRSPILARLALLTFLQASLAVAIYGVELQAVGHEASLRQTIAYAGAGSLALFVSLTPAAIGFRETFQYFSQPFHGVSDTAIVAANVLDRSAYIAVLGLLFLIVVAFHARSRFRM